jgi:hypothetical protein
MRRLDLNAGYERKLPGEILCITSLYNDQRSCRLTGVVRRHHPAMSRKDGYTMPYVLRLLCRATCTAACILAFLPAQNAHAQEFNCRVTVNYELLTGSDFGFLDQLDERIEEYINDRAWTNDRYEDVERIDCTIQITLEEALTLTSFRGRLVVAMRRPIYGTSQSTTVVQFTDPDLQFNYTQGTPLIFDLERYDPLTSVLDFYAFIMLGYDYDTFSEFGGTLYFAQARRIAEKAQSLGATGWSSVGGTQGRYQLISQILDARYRPLRKAYFTYHFGGLDHFVIETEVARERVLEVLQSLRELMLNVSRSYAIDVFFSAKYSELAAIFKDSPLSNQAYQLLAEVDPSHLSEYNELTQ